MTRLGLITALVSLVATGCLSSSSKDDGEPLAQDAYYIGVPSQYSSAGDCLAHSTHPYGWDCSFALTLCHTGEAALRIGDVIQSGSYAMEGGLAVGMIEQMQFEIDVATLTEAGEPIVGGVRWTHDTEGRSATLIYDTTDCR